MHINHREHGEHREGPFEHQDRCSSEFDVVWRWITRELTFRFHWSSSVILTRSVFFSP